MERRRNCDGDFVQMVNKILVISVIFVIPIIFHDIKKKKKKKFPRWIIFLPIRS